MTPPAGRGRRQRRWSRPRVPGEDVDPVAVRDALAVLGEEIGLGDTRGLTAVLAAWPDVVGAMIAEHARPRALREGILTVAVDVGPWATELRYLSDRVRGQLAPVVGADVVRELRIVVAPQTPPGAARDR